VGWDSSLSLLGCACFRAGWVDCCAFSRCCSLSCGAMVGVAVTRATESVQLLLDGRGFVQTPVRSHQCDPAPVQCATWATRQELRIAIARRGRADLHIRVHVLRQLRGRPARRRVPELRWRLRPPPDPAARRVASGDVAGFAPGHDRAAVPLLQPPGHPRTLRAAQGGPAGPALRTLGGNVPFSTLEVRGTSTAVDGLAGVRRYEAISSANGIFPSVAMEYGQTPLAACANR
jgi:hypothetical protein